MTCNGTRYPFTRTHDELRTALDPNVVGDDDEDGVALKKGKVVDGFKFVAKPRTRGVTRHGGPGRTSFCFLARARVAVINLLSSYFISKCNIVYTKA